MMKFRIFSVVLLVLVLFVIGVNAQISIPKPIGYMNDFAKKFSPEEVKALDDKLRAYDQTTTIQFVVVTLDSLQGRTEAEVALAIGREWKVGQADKNNGLVLLWAPNERRYRLEIGRGLEADITDGQAGALLRQHFVPNAKKDQGTLGVIDTVNAVINHLGNIPIVQRQEERARKAAAVKLEQEANSAWWSWFWGVVFIVVLFLILFVALPVYLVRKLILWWRERKRKIALRAELRETIMTHRKGVGSALKIFESNAEQLRKSLSRESDLAEFDKFLELGRTHVDYYKARLHKWESLIDDNVDSVNDDIQEPYFEPLDDWEKQMVELVQRFTSAVEVAPTEVVRAKDQIEFSRNALNRYVEKGYRIDIDSVLEESGKLVRKAEKLLEGKTYDPVLAVQHAEESQQSALAAVNSASEMIDVQSKTNNLIDSLGRELGRLDKYRQTSALSHASEIKPYPADVHKMIDSEFDEYLLEDWVKQTERHLKALVKENSMEVQQFSSAAGGAYSVQESLASIKKVLEQPRELKSQLTAAYRDFLASLPEVQSELESARKDVLHADVKQATRTLFMEAESLVLSSQNLDTQDPYQNWINNSQVLDRVNELLDVVIQRARSEKYEAEEEREEERAEALREAQRRSRRSDTSSYGGYSGGSSSSSSSGSFGGFSGGGGSFSGGGAGGGY